MKKSKPYRDGIIKPFTGNTHAETRVSGENSAPQEGPDADSSAAPTWYARLKRRWKSMLEWLAKGAEHACPT